MASAASGSRPATARGSGYRVLGFCIGLLLILASGLKTYDGTASPGFLDAAKEDRWFEFDIAVAEFELCFGLWLLSGILRVWTWRVTIVLFGAFTCVAFYKAFSGAASCGCFGQVVVNPWVTLLIDTSVLCLLLYWRPDRETHRVRRLWRRTCDFVWCHRVNLTLVVLTTMVIVTAIILPRRLSSAPARLHAEESVIDLGLIDPLQHPVASFSVMSASKQPIIIDSVKTDCGCAIASIDKYRVPPGDSARIDIRLDLSRSRGLDIVRRARLNYREENDESVRSIPLVVTGRLGEQYIRPLPRSIDFGEFSEPSSASLSILFRGERALLDQIPSEIVLGSPAPVRPIRLRRHGATAPFSKSVTFHLGQGFDELGSHESEFLVEVKGGQDQLLRIPVMATRLPKLYPVPTRLIVRRATSGNTVIQFMLSAHKQTPLRVTTVESDLPGELTVARAENLVNSLDVELHLNAAPANLPVIGNIRVSAELRSLDEDVEAAAEFTTNVSVVLLPS